MVYLTIAAMLALTLSPGLLPAGISLGHAVLRWRRSVRPAPTSVPAGHHAVPATA